MTASDRLSAKKARFLAALFTTSSIRDAAGECGISETSAYRYLADGDFQTALDSRLAALLDGASAALASDLETARDTLRQIMGDAGASPRARVAAAGKALDAAVRLIELRSFEKRLTAIEQRLAEGSGR